MGTARVLRIGISPGAGNGGRALSLKGMKMPAGRPTPFDEGSPAHQAWLAGMNQRFGQHQRIARRFDFRCQEWVVGLVIGAHLGFILAAIVRW